MTADKIINLLLSEFKTDQAGFAKMIGVHKSTISNILNRHTKSISSNVAQRIVQLRPEINYDFLIGKSDEMKTDVTDSVESQSKVFMKTLGRGKISIREITEFLIDNIHEFEKDDLFKIYKQSIENRAKAELLEKHIILRNRS